MGWRTIIVAERAKIDYRMGYMVVRGEAQHRVFMDEIRMVIVESTSVSLTAAWMNECIRRKVKVLFCDEKRNPVWEAIPSSGRYDTSRKIRQQIRWETEKKQAVWQRIIREKIRQQADVLMLYGLAEEAEKLQGYSLDVQAGDSTNREGHAAKVYFNALFGPAFSRQGEAEVNAGLNYGYAVLLSLCNREIAANGYLTQLGIFHDNIFNPFNLGSDLMEPFRPLIDRYVLAMEWKWFGTKEKRQIVNILNEKVCVMGKRVSVAHAVSLGIRKVLSVMEGAEMDTLVFYDCKE